jgi:hypothetical protein
MNDHYDESALQEYHDGLPGNSENATIRVHLEECQECAALDRRVIAFERAMRMIPLEQPGPACTTQVLARIARPAPAEWLDRVLEPRIIAGATIGLFGIAGTVSAVLLAMPVRSGAETRSLWAIALDGTFREIVAGPDVLAGWATRVFPQVFSQGALQVSLAVVLLLPLFLFADRILARRRVMG